MSPSPGPGRVHRWTPWALGAAVAIAYVVIGPGGVDAGAPVWSALCRLVALVPIGEVGDRIAVLGAACAGAAAVLIARLAIAMGGGEVAAVAGAIAATAVVVGAGAWGHAAVTGPTALVAALVLAAIALADRVAAGGGVWPGAAAGAVLGVAIAADRSALAIVPVVVALLALRVRHGARWPLVVPAVGAVAWLVAMIAVWRGPVAAPAAPIDDARYALELADAVGAIAVVAAAVGMIAALARRTTRWSGALVIAAVAGGIALDRLASHPASAIPLVGLALAAGLGVTRLARLAAPPFGQACLGAAAAVIVAAPAALAAF